MDMQQMIDQNMGRMRSRLFELAALSPDAPAERTSRYAAVSQAILDAIERNEDPATETPARCQAVANDDGFGHGCRSVTALGRSDLLASDVEQPTDSRIRRACVATSAGVIESVHSDTSGA
jgi:hypothetical protein